MEKKVSFRSLIKNKNYLTKVSIGTNVEGIITGETKLEKKDYFLIQAGLKTEGYLLMNEFISDRPVIGDKVKVMIVAEKDGIIFVSVKGLLDAEKKKQIKRAFLNRSIIDAVVQSQLNNGYKVLIFENKSVFLIDKNPLEVGAVVRVYISKMTPNGNITVVPALSDVESSAINCIVKVVSDHGIVVDLDNGQEGFIHVQDLDWHKINPKNVYKIGDKIEAKILPFTEDSRLLLSVKLLKPDKWIELSKQFEVDKVYDCIIKEIKQYGLVVQLLNDNIVQEDNICGFIQRKQLINFDKMLISLDKFFKIGDKIQCKIKSIDIPNRTFVLDVKGLDIENYILNEINKYFDKIKVGDIVEGVVLNDPTEHNCFVFISLYPGIDGMLHMNSIDWNYKISQEKFLEIKKGSTISTKIISADKANRQISLSIKKMKGDMSYNATKQLKVGDLYDVTIINVLNNGISVRFKDYGIIGFIYKKELSKDKFIRPGKFVSGQLLKAKLIVCDPENRKIHLSLREEEVIEEQMIKRFDDLNLSDLF